MPHLSTWRRVGSEDQPYPQWFRDLKGRSGIYAIRFRQSGRIHWVGESTGGSKAKGLPNLYKTIARHLQQWERVSRSEKAHYEYPRSDTYTRDNVEVAVWVASYAKGKPLTMPQRQRLWDLEHRYICEMNPVDNQHYATDCRQEDVPF